MGRCSAATRSSCRSRTASRRRPALRRPRRRAVVGGLCATFSFVAAPGPHPESGQVHSLRFGELDRRQSERRSAPRELRAAGVRANISDDIHVSLLGKVSVRRSVRRSGRGDAGAGRRDERSPETGAMVQRGWRRSSRSAALEASIFRTIRGRALGFIDALDPAAPCRSSATSPRASRRSSRPGTAPSSGSGQEAGVPTPVHAFLYSRLPASGAPGAGELVFHA
jgi:hypothetical protein